MLPRRFLSLALLALAAVLAGATARLPGRAYAFPQSTFTQNCGAPSEFFFDIPAGVTRISVSLVGAAGGTSGGSAGAAGVAAAKFNVTAGQRYYLDLGCQGHFNGDGGWNGGGSSPLPVVTPAPMPPWTIPAPAGNPGAGGGGASVIRTSPCATLPQPCSSGALLVAAGGGGGGGASAIGTAGAGGGGGSLLTGAGLNGQDNSNGSPSGGGGATASAPGLPGPFGNSGSAGDIPGVGSGGAGAAGNVSGSSPPTGFGVEASGGGGGGGCHGGAGGSAFFASPNSLSGGGGGGGSSCASAQAIDPSFTPGSGGDGAAIINYFMAPTITKTITSASPTLVQGGTATLHFSLANPQADHALTNVSFVDDLSSAGLVVASTPNSSTTCAGGTYAGLTFNSNLLNVGGISLPVSGNCTFSVDVTLTSAGTKTNTTGPVSSTESGPGATASVSFTVVSPTSGTLTVHKHFSDSNAGSVSFAVSCTAGATPAASPLTATGTPDAPAVFTINNIPAGGTVCTATEPTVPSGYTADASGCSSVALAQLGNVSCIINNTVTPVVHTTTTSVVTSGTPSTLGAPVTFTATVTDTTASVPATSGSVTFVHGVTLATVPVNGSGQAVFTTSSLTVGSHVIFANYGGVPGTLLASTGTVSQLVNPAPPPGVAPLITSANTTTFTVGAAGTFTVTATGTAPVTLAQVGALPSGVTFDAATGVLSGTPAAGSAGSYPLIFTATNSVNPPANQSFTLVVNPAPQSPTPTCVPNTKGCVVIPPANPTPPPPPGPSGPPINKSIVPLP